MSFMMLINVVTRKLFAQKLLLTSIFLILLRKLRIEGGELYCRCRHQSMQVSLWLTKLFGHIDHYHRPSILATAHANLEWRVQMRPLLGSVFYAKLRNFEIWNWIFLFFYKITNIVNNVPSLILMYKVAKIAPNWRNLFLKPLHCLFFTIQTF